MTGDVSFKHILFQIGADPARVLQQLEGGAALRRATVAGREDVGDEAKAIGLGRAPQTLKLRCIGAVDAPGVIETIRQQGKLGAHIGNRGKNGLRGREYRFLAGTLNRQPRVRIEARPRRA